MLYSYISKFGLLKLTGIAVILAVGFVLFQSNTSFAADNTKSCTYNYNAGKTQITVDDCETPSPIKKGAVFKLTSTKTPRVYTLNTTKGSANDFDGAIGNLKCSAKITVKNPSGAASSGTLSGNAILPASIATKCQPVSGAVKIGVDDSNIQIQADEASKSLIASLAAFTNAYCARTQRDTQERCQTATKATVKKCSDTAHRQATTIVGSLVNGVTLDKTPAEQYRESVIDCLVTAGLGTKEQVSLAVTEAVATAAFNKAAAAKIDQDVPDNPDDADTTSCAVDGVGWIVCPVMEFIGDLNDKAYGFLSDSFLQLDPDLMGPDTEAAWKSFRDIDNVLFAIAFLIIIYTQITGAGLSNYGLKKMLPKLIIAAILVNVSFILCKVAVDLSNIVGNSVPSFFDVSFSTTADGTPTTANTDMPLWKDAIGAALIAGTAVVGLVLVLSLGLPGLLALVVVVLILVARKAAIILLVVVSPIAFVAYLLPNTDQWFKKWWKLFSSLLILYPVIGIVFGASALAAKIINNGDPIMQLTALGVSVLPLFAVPLLLKGSMSALGTIGNRLSSLSDRANKKAVNNMKEGRLGEAKAAFDARRQSNKINRRLGHGRVASWGESRVAQGKRGGKALQWAGTRQKALDESRFAGALGADRGRAAATNAYNKELFEETERQMSTMGEMDADELLTIGMDKGSSAERRAAAFRKLEVAGGHQHIQKAFDYLDEAGARGDDAAIGDVQQLSADALLKRKPVGVRTSEGNKLREGKLGKGKAEADSGYYGMFASRVQEGAFGAKDYATMDKDDLIRLGEMSATPGMLSDDDINAMTAQFAAIENDETLKGTMTDERRALYESIMTRSGPMRADGVTARNVDRNGNVIVGVSTGGLAPLR